MKKLGAYIGDRVYGGSTTGITILEQNTFVWYEVIQHLSPTIGWDVYEVSIWSLNGGYPNRRKPDAMYSTTSPHSIDSVVIPMKKVADDYCIEWEDRTWKIQESVVSYNYLYGYEHIASLEFDLLGSNSCHWKWEGYRAMETLKNATVSKFLKKPQTTVADIYPATIKEELKKSLEQDVMKSALNSCYGMGGFTTTNDFVSNRVLSVNEALEIWEKKNKETKTMEKKTMTETYTFLKHMNGITITSTYSKLDFGDFGDPYYIYYPEIEITESVADTLLTILLMAKREYIHKVVFNPEKGTTTISKSVGDPVTVRCKDGEFDYILGYEMARSKMYLGHNDYNWFNKIKNHRKTHIEYTEKPTEPKAKRTSKKGGKK